VVERVELPSPLWRWWWERRREVKTARRAMAGPKKQRLVALRGS
jgi:hypothetical protein